MLLISVTSELTSELLSELSSEFTSVLTNGQRSVDRYWTLTTFDGESLDNLK